ncbi:sugar phosphate nucleotidyltransferase [Paenibacillus sp. Soil787]|uniref:sugar phosphate nucleotidyltransferase n=1 Tax=Paenibacillus sp. Soil787 TaxID=1736411 RepID=UPI000702BD13|nr:sugar phosphate nucleotidyltransferase [Paenibacillus sp. Soil787]KRF18683.1 mannose-1-phosphate guanylyltransferase [Paenibacillus sp. Soil787]
MKLILLSGGSGKRLWPLSNESRSKQFLKVLRNQNLQMESMMQRVWSQLKSADLTGSVYVATSKSQSEIIQSQLDSSIRLIVEPERRDTFPAIALACTYLHSVVKTDANETVCILPVDPYVENQFFSVLKELETMQALSDCEILLIGVKPDHPSEKYGYIVPDEGSSKGPCMRVNRFIEKPGKHRAQMLMEENALWNCGIFAFKLGYMVSLLQHRGIPVQYEKLRSAYSTLPKTSFDYEIVEKTSKLAVYPYNGSWKDLGSWETLTEELDTSVLGKGTLSESCRNTHVINELDIPIKVIGLSNIVVAASPDGILVADKSASTKIKELMDDDDQRLMYEERRWGWYRVLDYAHDLGGNERLTKKIIVHAGKNPSYQIHYKRKEVWMILSGEGLFALNNRLNRVSAGDVLQIPAGAGHSIKATTNLEMIEVQLGSELVEEDTIRLFMTWDQIEEYCLGRG